MFNLKEKLNKSNILVAATILLSATVIGQSIYIAKLYGKETASITKLNISNQLVDKTPSVNKPYSIFDDFDNNFMANHFKEFRKIKEHMDKVFDDAFSEFNVHPGLDDDFTSIFGRSKLTDNLNLELQNNPEKFTVTLTLSNSHKDKDNINVILEGQKLTVSGNIQEKIEESNNLGKQYKEYSSKFTRSIILPEKVVENSLSTKFQNNKLIITILKKETV